MANPIYRSMNQQPDFMSAINNLKNNAMQIFSKSRFNVPQDVMNDPNAIIQHLMNTGQVSQQQYNNAMRIVNQFKNMKM